MSGASSAPAATGPNASAPASRWKVTVGIPEVPTQEEVDRVLARLTLTDQLTLDEIWTNIEEYLRLRGTEGEPIPEFEQRMAYEKRVVWDDAEPLAPEDRRTMSLGQAAAWYDTIEATTGKSSYAVDKLMRDMERRKRANQPAPCIICIDSEHTPNDL